MGACYTQKAKECHLLGSNQGPSDLQSDALPTELYRREWERAGGRSCVRSLGKNKNMPPPGIEPGTFRSSVWRSPNWAIAAIVTQGNASKFNSRSMNFIFIEKSSEERFRSSDLWVMSPTRYRCATSLQVIQNVELTNLFNEHWFASVIAPVA